MENIASGLIFRVICPLEHANAHLKRIVAAQAFDILKNPEKLTIRSLMGFLCKRSMEWK